MTTCSIAKYFLQPRKTFLHNTTASLLHSNPCTLLLSRNMVLEQSTFKTTVHSYCFVWTQLHWRHWVQPIVLPKIFQEIFLRVLWFCLLLITCCNCHLLWAKIGSLATVLLWVPFQPMYKRTTCSLTLRNIT